MKTELIHYRKLFRGIQEIIVQTSLSIEVFVMIPRTQLEIQAVSRVTTLILLSIQMVP